MIIRAIILAELAYGTALASGFIIFIGGSFDDVAKAVSLLDINVYMLVIYVILLAQQNTITNLFDELEGAIQKRRFKILVFSPAKASK